MSEYLDAEKAVADYKHSLRLANKISVFALIGLIILICILDVVGGIKHNYAGLLLPFIVIFFFWQNIRIHWKLAKVLKENGVISMTPIMYGLLMLLSWLLLNFIGYLIYLKIVQRHTERLKAKFLVEVVKV